MTFRAGFVIEQTLGHVTHGQNLRRLLAGEPDLETHWLDVPFRPSASVYRLPPFSLNWSLRGGLFVRRGLMADGWRELDAAFLHTLTIALLATPYYQRVPTVISVDATPAQIDALGDGYAHRRQPGPVETLKHALVRRALSQARAYVSWSEWAKTSLVDDYGVPADRVLVATPGTDVDLFRKTAERRPGPPRILFVGGDFVRKGGDVLLKAFRERLRGRAELHLVTGHAVAAEEGVFHYPGLTANSEPLVELFRQADVFALPTRADCLAVVLGEAKAASLPIVTTGVGAHAEAVEDGRTGFVVPPDDDEALGDALVHLVEDEALRREMSERARADAEERFDARKNARRVIELMRSVAA